MEASVVDQYPSRTRARLETRARVLESALAEFHRVGVDAAQVEDIVRAAGVARGTFYLHFPSKDHVLMELLAECGERIAARLEGAEPQDPARVLRVVVDGIVAEVVGKHRALVPDSLGVIARNPADVARRAAALPQRLTAFLGCAQQAGTVRGETAPADLAAVFLSSVAGLLLTRRQSSTRGLRSALRRTVELLEPVLLTAPAARRAAARRR